MDPPRWKRPAMLAIAVLALAFVLLMGYAFLAMTEGFLADDTGQPYKWDLWTAYGEAASSMAIGLLTLALVVKEL